MLKFLEIGIGEGSFSGPKIFIIVKSDELCKKVTLRKRVFVVIVCIYELVTCWCHLLMIEYVSSPGTLDKYSPV